MTPAEVAALRERLTNTPQYYDPFGTINTVRAADLRAALALLDAQAAEIARLTAEREREVHDARYIGSETMRAALVEYVEKSHAAHAIARGMRGIPTPAPAPAPAPAAEVAG